MAVKLAFIGLVPDADYEKHRCLIKTPQYHFSIVMVENQKRAIEVCKTLASEDGVDQITFCPGFTYVDVGEISKVIGDGVAIAVARRDGISERIMTKAKEREGLI